MVCYGTGCNVTFTNVKFDSCTLLVLARAKVTLRNCTFSCSPTATDPDGVHVFAHALTTCVDMRDSTVTGGAMGVACHEDAKVTLTNVTFTDVHGVACESRGGRKGALHLTACKMRYTPTVPPHLASYCGLLLLLSSALPPAVYERSGSRIAWFITWCIARPAVACMAMGAPMAMAAPDASARPHGPCWVLAHGAIAQLQKVDIRGVAVGVKVVDGFSMLEDCSVSNVSDRCLVYQEQVFRLSLIHI